MRGAATGACSRAIDFVLAGGRTTGLGHVARCATLATEATRRGWSVRAFLDGDAAASTAWRERTGLPVDGGFAAWSPRRPDDVVALDFPTDKRAWLARAARARASVLVIDDERAAPGARWILLPGLHHGVDAPVAEASDRTRQPGWAPPHRLVGARYAVLAEAHRRFARRPRAERTRLLVSIGGADPHRLTPRVGEALSASLVPDSASVDGVDVVLGPAFVDPGRRMATALTRLGFQVHHALSPERMAERMASARLAIVGFGTSLTELAWHGTPFLCVTHRSADLAPARQLARSGIGRVLGTAEALDANAMTRAIAEAIHDDEWQRYSATQAHAALAGGHGAERVFTTLERDLAQARPPERAQPGSVA